MKNRFRKGLLFTRSWEETETVVYFVNKTDDSICFSAFFTDKRSASRYLENGDIDGYDFSEDVVKEVYYNAFKEGYEEITEEEFMKIVDERYPGWREQLDED